MYWIDIHSYMIWCHLFHIPHIKQRSKRFNGTQHILRYERNNISANAGDAYRISNGTQHILRLDKHNASANVGDAYQEKYQKSISKSTAMITFGLSLSNVLQMVLSWLWSITHSTPGDILQDSYFVHTIRGLHRTGDSCLSCSSCPNHKISSAIPV